MSSGLHHHRHHKLIEVLCWPAVVCEMPYTAWEEPGNHLLSYVVESATGLVAATAVFGPELDLLVTACAGGNMRAKIDCAS